MVDGGGPGRHRREAVDGRAALPLAPRQLLAFPLRALDSRQGSADGRHLDGRALPADALLARPPAAGRPRQRADAGRDRRDGGRAAAGGRVIPLRATFEESVWKRVLSIDERLLLSVRRW